MNTVHTLRHYFSRVIYRRQIMVLLSSVVLVVLGYVFSLELFIGQLSRQSDDMAWYMDEFVGESLDLFKVIASLVQPQTDLDRIMAQYDFFESMSLIGADRKLVSRSPRDSRFFPGMDMSGRFLSEPGTANQYGHYFFAPDTGMPSLESSTPLPDGGWLNIEINLEHLQDQLAHFRIGNYGKAYLSDDYRRYLAHPDYERVRTRDFVDPHIVMEKAIDGQLVWLEGTFFLVHASRLKELHAWLLVEVDVLDLVSPYAITMAVVVVLLLLATILFMKKQRSLLDDDLLWPVLGLNAMSSLVADGTLEIDSRRVPDSRIQEIRNLKKAFFFMISRIREQRGYLERTLANLQSRNREMQSFTHAVSHDLRSPLITIQGFLSFLPEAFAAGDHEAFRTDLERIQSASKTMEAHLQDILSLSRIGRVDALPTRESLADCARSAADLLETCWVQAGTRPIISPDLPVLLVHRHQIVELFQNLFENAWKYRLPDQALRIELKMADHDWMELTDNGKGFDPAGAERIFTLFERLDHTVPGNGVGLAVVRRILETHNGEISARSDGPGQGATFRFRLDGFTAQAIQGSES